MPRMIPCPECTKGARESFGLEKEFRSQCPLCKQAGPYIGTIPDHRAPTANDRAVERILALAVWNDWDAGGSTMLSKIKNIIREEAGDE